MYIELIIHCTLFFFLRKIFILSTVLYFLYLLFASYTLFCILQCSIYISEPISNICMNISYLIHNIVHFSLSLFCIFLCIFFVLFLPNVVSVIVYSLNSIYNHYDTLFFFIHSICCKIHHIYIMTS